MPRLVVVIVAAAGLALVAGDAHSRPWPDPPPNVVQATAKIFTSGQPPARSLEGLEAQGFEAVV